MAIQYSQNLTLKDIFNNRTLRGKLPFIGVKEAENTDGKRGVRTSAKSVEKLIYEKAVSSARPHYSSLVSSKTGNLIKINGSTEKDLDFIVDEVYNGLIEIKSILSYTANYTDIIRTALKESSGNKRYGLDTKLYLRATSIEEIRGMGKRQLNMLMNDVVKNIMFGNDFPKTQKKFDVENLFKRGLTYNQRKAQWFRDIGE